MGGSARMVQAITFESAKNGFVQKNRIFPSIRSAAKNYGVAMSTIRDKIDNGKGLERNGTVVYFDFWLREES